MKIINNHMLILDNQGSIIVDSKSKNYRISFIMKIREPHDGWAHLLEHFIINMIESEEYFNKSLFIEGKTDYMSIEIIIGKIDVFEDLLFIIQSFFFTLGIINNSELYERKVAIRTNMCFIESKKEVLNEIEKKFLSNKRQLKINEVLISQKLDELPIGSSNSIRSCSLKKIKKYFQLNIVDIFYIGIVKDVLESKKIQEKITRLYSGKY